ncbi:MAG: hypothetical protein DWQ07_18160 [Chloroflexi bacterium]|nr:MAG: hypothetical protein DWQ07_18160 [Chloroflexota bacterium]MBL1197393.1 hypothetical protein [Chloroflexota bacterium]
MNDTSRVNNDLAFDLLVMWYAFFQGLHIPVDIKSFVSLKRANSVFHYPPPIDGWSDQALNFFEILFVLDLINAILSLVFVYGFFKHARWRWWLGAIALTASICMIIVFDYATIASGAWDNNLAPYLSTNILLLPTWVLFFLFLRRSYSQPIFPPTLTGDENWKPEEE